MSVFIDRPQVASDKAPVILWDNLFTQGNIVASSEGETTAPKENVANGNTYDFWQADTMPATIEVRLDSLTQSDYTAIAAHNLGSLGITVSVETWDGSNYIEVGRASPTDDSTLFIAHELSTSVRKRLYFSGSATAPSIGVISTGKAIKFETGILPSYTPIVYGEDIELLKSQSLSGQFITNRVNRRGASSSFNLNILDRSFVEGTDFQNFRRHYNDGKPFFFASNPVELDFDCAYAWRQDGGEIRPTFEQNGIFYQTSLNIEAYIGL